MDKNIERFLLVLFGVLIGFLLILGTLVILNFFDTIVSAPTVYFTPSEILEEA